MANKHMKSSKIIMLWGNANKSHNDISPHVLEWPGQRRYQSVPDLGMGTAHTHTHTHKMGVNESVLYLDCGSDDVSMCLSKLKELHDKK